MMNTAMNSTMDGYWNIVEGIDADLGKHVLLRNTQHVGDNHTMYLSSRPTLLNALVWDSHLRIVSTPNIASTSKIGRTSGRSPRDLPGRKVLINALTRVTCSAP